MTVNGRELAAALAPPPIGVRRTLRLALLALLAIGAASAWRWGAILDPTMLTAAIDRYPAAPLAFFAVHIAASLLFVPRTPLAIVAGLLFGMGWGIVLAASGSVAGAMAGFLIARYINSGLIDLRRLGSVVGRVERGGWRGVAVLRLIPVLPHSVANYALGLTRLSLGAYTFGSLLGQLPMTIAYVDLGAAGERLMLGGANSVEPTLIGLSVLGLSLLIPAIACRQAS
jgi:uncharacterized membrane protein YdjX (TVP38/TMEM64 family)